MIKTEEKTRTVTEKIHKVYCDECGGSVTDRHHYNHGRRCERCNCDVCSKCSVELFDSSDYSTIYCNSCWNMKYNEELTYEQKIKELESEIDRIYEQWDKKCKEERELKNGK